MNDEERLTKKATFDYDEFDTICFDEAYLHVPSRQKKIDRFIKNNPDKIIIGCGDAFQSEAIGCEDPNIIDNCINVIFKNQIEFTEIKRLKNEEDKKIMKNLKSDIFENNLSYMEIIKKYNFNTIDNIKDLTTLNNIS